MQRRTNMLYIELFFKVYILNCCFGYYLDLCLLVVWTLVDVVHFSSISEANY